METSLMLSLDAAERVRLGFSRVGDTISKPSGPVSSSVLPPRWIRDGASADDDVNILFPADPSSWLRASFLAPP